MEVEQWYAIALGVLLALFALRRIWLFLDRWIVPRFLSFFLRHIRYRLLLRGREWLPWTWFEAICLLLYLIASIFAEFLFVQTLREMERRAAILVTVSLFPLYVSGKTHLALDWLGMPLPSYVFLQRSMCGIALFYSIIHFVGVLQLRVRAGEIATSGYIVSLLHYRDLVLIGSQAAGSLLAIWILWLVGFLLSLYLRRAVFSSAFQAMHTTLTLASLAGLFWHVLSLPSPTNTSRGTVLAAAIIWLLSALVRLLRVIYRGRARIQGRRDYKKVVRIHVRFKRRINIAPGSYFYVLFPSLRNIVYSYPFIAIPFDFTSTAPQGIRDFVFILDADKHSRILNRLHEGRSLLLDGPYGSEDGGEPYENLILTARGIGIVGILPTALEIARRKRHNTVVKERVQELQKKQSQLLLELQQTSSSDLESLKKELARIGREEAAIQANPLDRSTTRRVDILWELDDNTQAEWIQSQIKALQDSDPRGVSCEPQIMGTRLTLIDALRVLVHFPFPRGQKCPASIQDYGSFSSPLSISQPTLFH